MLQPYIESAITLSDMDTSPYHITPCSHISVLCNKIIKNIFSVGVVQQKTIIYIITNCFI